MEKLKNYVNGAWTMPKKAAFLPVVNPSTGETLAEMPLSSAAAVKEAAAAARRAFPGWAATPVARRVACMFKLAELMRAKEDLLMRSICREMGKSLGDAGAETKRTLENTEIACAMPIMQQGDKLIGASQDIDGEVLRMPVGVFGLIAPFNFPAMVPFWFIPYALASGNTFVAKPSRQAPITMNLLAGLIHESGFPTGVFNLVNGDHSVGSALIEEPEVNGICVVGSTPVCRKIAEQCARLNKRCMAMGSAKNHLVAMPDARIDDVVRNMTTSCYGCAGQRCMAASVIVCVGKKTCDAVTQRFLEQSRRITLADPLDPAAADNPFAMGPVISAKARDFILQMIDAGVAEGAALALDGRNYTPPKGCEKGYFVGPTVFTGVKPGMKIHATEIFGPVVCIMEPVSSLDEALAVVNSHEYGNGASIYTQNGFYARKFKLEAQAGMIGVNIGIPAPVAALPFGGMRASMFADIKAQGKAIVRFFTDEKIITERFWPEP